MHVKRSFRQLSCLLIGIVAAAQPPAFELDARLKRTVNEGVLVPLAQLRARDGGRFVVSRTDSPDLILEKPFQAVFSGSSLAYSADGGNSFQAVEVPGIRQVQSLYLGVRSAGLRYVLGDFGSFAISRDGGDSWQSFLALNGGVLSGGEIEPKLVVDPRDESVIYQTPALEGSPIGRWSPEAGTFFPVSGLPVGAVGPYLRPRVNQLFAAAGDSLYLSLTPGGEWQVFAKLPQGQTVAEAVFDVAGTRRIYVRSQQGVLWRTNDDGANWQRIAVPASSEFGVATRLIEANPNRAGHVIFLTVGQAYVSTDGGSTLTAVRLPVAGDLEFEANSTTTVYAGKRQFVSQDSGLTWQEQRVNRRGRRVCSVPEPQKCYAVGDRFQNFYIEKFNADNQLEWTSYWGDDDPDLPRSAFVDAGGVLWLQTGRKVARIAPEGRVIDVRNTAAQASAVVETGNRRLVALVAGRLQEWDRETLAPIGAGVAVEGAVPPLVAAEDRVAFRSAATAGVYRVGEAAVSLLPGEANFVPKAMAWAADGALLLAGDRTVSGGRRRVELLAWRNGAYQRLATLEGDAGDVVESMSLDAAGQIWILGATASQNFPQSAPIYSGPAKTMVTGFATLLGPNGGAPIFSSYFPRAGFSLPGAAGLDVLLVEGGDEWGLPVFGLPGAYTHARIAPKSGAGLRLDRLERRFDGSGGNWSRGAWMRVRSRDLANLSEFSLPVWSPDRPKVHEGVRLLMNGQPLTLIGAGPGYVEATLDGLESDENDAPALLVLERSGNLSQTMRLQLDRFDFELLPRVEQADLALCYNADGTENSEANPAPAGSQVALFAIGSQSVGEVYLNPEMVGEFVESEGPSYASDYVQDVPGVLPGIRYIGLTLRGVGRFSGTRKVGLYRYYEDKPSLYIWVRGD